MTEMKPVSKAATSDKEPKKLTPMEQDPIDTLIDEIEILIAQRKGYSRYKEEYDCLERIARFARQARNALKALQKLSAAFS